MALPKSITDNLKEGGTLTLIKTSAEGGKAIIGEIRTISAVHSNYVVTRGSDGTPRDHFRDIKASEVVINKEAGLLTTTYPDMESRYIEDEKGNRVRKTFPLVLTYEFSKK